jgi:hypothetical protein
MGENGEKARSTVPVQRWSGGALVLAAGNGGEVSIARLKFVPPAVKSTLQHVEFTGKGVEFACRE